MLAPAWAQPMTSEKALVEPEARASLSPGVAAGFVGRGMVSGQLGVARKVDVGSPGICSGGNMKPGGAPPLESEHDAPEPASPLLAPSTWPPSCGAAASSELLPESTCAWPLASVDEDWASAAEASSGDAGLAEEEEQAVAEGAISSAIHASTDVRLIPGT